jgi:hypothetical protein
MSDTTPLMGLTDKLDPNGWWACFIYASGAQNKQLYGSIFGVPARSPVDESVLSAGSVQHGSVTTENETQFGAVVSGFNFATQEKNRTGYKPTTTVQTVIRSL